MAPLKKRSCKRSQKNGKKYSVNDFMCPICLCILIEPVTLPCNHELCKHCLEEIVTKAALCCPVCRHRISSWSRKAANDDSLVNLEKWELIQKHFPDHVQRRLNGNETTIDGEDMVSVIGPKISSPGSIRREYEEQLHELEKNRKQQHEEENYASEKLIKKLIAEEENRIKLIAENDSRIAKNLAEYLQKGKVQDDTFEVENFLVKKQKEYSNSASEGASSSNNAGSNFQYMSPTKCSGASNYLPTSNKENSLCHPAVSQLNPKFMTSTPSCSKSKNKITIFSPVNQNVGFSPIRQSNHKQIESDFNYAKNLQKKLDLEKRKEEVTRRAYSLRRRKT